MSDWKKRSRVVADYVDTTNAAPSEVHGAPSRSEAFGRGAAQGATFGFGDEIGGVIQALGEKYLPESMGGGGEQAASVSLADLYRKNRDTFRREDAAAEAANKGWYIGGNLAGGLMTAPLMPGAGTGRTLAQLAGHGAKIGAGAGAAYGLGASGADLTRGEYGRATVDTGAGAALGGVLGAAAPPVASGIGYVAQKVGAPLMSMIRGGYIHPTQEAQRLGQKGVELTLGQMDPASSFGRIEELAASKVTGGSVNAARQKAADGGRDVLLEAAGAPGAVAPTRGAPVAQQLDELRAGYSQVYRDALDGVHIQPDKYLGSGKWRGLMTDPAAKGAAKVKGAFELAAEAKNINASDAVRKNTLAWLRNEATSLAPTKSGPNAGKVEARAVQELRTRLRDEVRSLGDEGDDRAAKQILQRAEEFVSELLEGQLPPERASMLRGADASYRNLLSVEDAAKRAFVQNQELTPAQLLQAIRSRGATPDLESVARDAQSVFAARYAPTGVQVAATEAAPLLRYLGPAWAAMANSSPALRSHALKPLWMPGVPARATRAAGSTLRSLANTPRATSLGGRTLAELLSGPPPPPALSDREREEARR